MLGALLVDVLREIQFASLVKKMDNELEYMDSHPGDRIEPLTTSQDAESSDVDADSQTEKLTDHHHEDSISKAVFFHDTAYPFI